MAIANNSFAVEIPTRDMDPNLFYKKELLTLITNKYPHFTVSGKVPPAINRGVEYASHGNLLTFGTAKTHDVEWVERPGYVCEKGYAPIFNLVKDWNKIVSRLDALNDELYPKKLKLSNGMDVEFFENFVKIGYNRVAYKANSFVGYWPSALSVLLSNDDIEALFYNRTRY